MLEVTITAYIMWTLDGFEHVALGAAVGAPSAPLGSRARLVARRPNHHDAPVCHDRVRVRRVARAKLRGRTRGRIQAGLEGRGRGRAGRTDCAIPRARESGRRARRAPSRTARLRRVVDPASPAVARARRRGGALRESVLSPVARAPPTQRAWPPRATFGTRDPLSAAAVARRWRWW